jgi:starch synthase
MALASAGSIPRVLFVTPELHPLIKTGGLGDISAALPQALRKLDVDVRILIPGYPSVLAGLPDKQEIAQLPAQPPFPAATLLSASSPGAVPVFIIDCPALYQRAGNPYLGADGRDWPDNALRFGLLSKTGALLSSDASPLSWRPEIAHGNDWQSGLLPAYLNFHSGEKAASLITIHNLAYQGVFPPDTVPQLGLPPESFKINGVEYFGGMSFLKAGLYYSDHITTVSPTYAREIQTASLGFGLEGLLASRRSQVSGIVNGIDTAEWNPATDRALVRNYTAASLSVKAANKMPLQRRMGLSVAPHIPLFGAVSRFTYQKGYDLLLQIANRLTELPAQLIVLGNGDPGLEQELTGMARRHPGKIAVRIGFDEKLAHLIEAGADCFLMPSRFEPCGLNQMYSQRYGTPPLAHATGGLLDTVVDCSPASLADRSASGFLFPDMTASSFLDAILRANAAYQNKPVWRSLMHNGMIKDFSWCASAARYRNIYLSLLS